MTLFNLTKANRDHDHREKSQKLPSYPLPPQFGPCSPSRVLREVWWTTRILCVFNLLSFWHWPHIRSYDYIYWLHLLNAEVQAWAICKLWTFIVTRVSTVSLYHCCADPTPCCILLCCINHCSAYRLPLRYLNLWWPSLENKKLQI